MDHEASGPGKEPGGQRTRASKDQRSRHEKLRAPGAWAEATATQTSKTKRNSGGDMRKRLTGTPTQRMPQLQIARTAKDL